MLHINSTPIREKMPPSTLPQRAAGCDSAGERADGRRP